MAQRGSQMSIAQTGESSSPDHRRFTIGDHLRASRHEEGLAILDVRKGLIYVGNLTGAHIWEGIRDGHTPTAIEGDLSRLCGVSFETAYAGTMAFLNELHARGFIAGEVGHAN